VEEVQHVVGGVGKVGERGHVVGESRLLETLVPLLAPQIDAKIENLGISFEVEYKNL
jgi:hypothetical protein